MKSPTKLTIVLTLRGRHLHTLRWLWHANRIGLPYHVIIADGEVHPAIDRLLSDAGTFQNLSYEYHRHCDGSFSDFYRKWAGATRKVGTDYVMLSDNDDFPVVAGIERSIEWLDGHAGYVCAGGQLPDFAIVPRSELPGKVIGRMLGPRFGYKHRCRDISSPSVSERVMDEMIEYQTIHYHVYRAETLKTIVGEIETHDFSDLTVAEFYSALRTVTLGRVRSDASAICYLRQTGTSMLSTYYRDWVHHLLRSRLPQDYQALAVAIAGEVSQTGGDEPDAFREAILDAYGNKLRHMLAHTMMRYRFPRLFRLKQKLTLVRRLPGIPVWLRQWVGRRMFWRKFAGDCSTPGDLALYRTEFREIEASLEGDEFLSFVRSNAPEIVGD